MSQPWQKHTKCDTTDKMNDILGNLQSSLDELAQNRTTMEQKISSPRFNPQKPESTDKPSPFKFTKVTAPTVIYPSDKAKMKQPDFSSKMKQSHSNSFSEEGSFPAPPPPVAQKPVVQPVKSPVASSFPAPPPAVSTPVSNQEKFKINEIDNLLDDLDDLNLDSPLAGKKISTNKGNDFSANKRNDYSSPLASYNNRVGDVPPSSTYVKPQSPPPPLQPKPVGNAPSTTEYTKPSTTAKPNLFEQKMKRSNSEAEKEVNTAIERLQQGLKNDNIEIQQLCCYKCNGVIQKEAATVLGENFHPDCFTCSRCFKPLKTGVEFFVVGQKNPVCNLCYEDTLTTCYACGQKITQGRIVKALGHDYHPACFNCCECGVNLDGKKFASDKDDDGNITAQSKPYCVNCYGQKFAPKCHRCHNAIIGGDATISRIVVGNDEYCEGCFVCKTQGCGKSLKSGAYPVKDIHGTELFCEPCAIECQRRNIRANLGR